MNFIAIFWGDGPAPAPGGGGGVALGEGEADMVGLGTENDGAETVHGRKLNTDMILTPRE